MHRLFLAIILCALPMAAQAEPGYFRVTGVASDDTLNVRAEPDASSADIGDLPFNARGVEVIGTDASGRWGRILWEDGNGWVSMRFLEPDEMQPVAGTALPAGLLCGGTEPFWTLRLSPASASFSDLDGATHVMGLSGARVAEGRGRFPVQLGFSGETAAGTALIRPALCSDGMSDRVHPWQIDLLLNAGGTGSYKVGCCHLPLEAGFH